MITSVLKFDSNNIIWNPNQSDLDANQVQLVLVFGNKELIKTNVYESLRKHFPNAAIVITSTAGEIFQDEVLDDSIVVAALQFEKTTVETSSINIKDFSNSFEAGEQLIANLPKEGLAHILVFSDGSIVNGSELVKGIKTKMPKKLMVTGGLAGDGSHFVSTLVGINETPIEGRIVAIGLYGNDIEITHGNQGGWNVFGLEKTVTKSLNNVLYEIDGKSALDLYKKYLGDEVKNLPSSALLFPLSVAISGASQPVVRTILSIDEVEKTMTFAGDIPVNSKVRFMKANFENLRDAATNAAENSLKNTTIPPCFSLLISCVGRKLILGERVSDEVKAISNTFQHKTSLAGFYSYGEISPFNEGGACQLHNQTMTITSFYER